MTKPVFIAILIFILAMLACRSDELLFPQAPPTSTATFELARFTTATPLPALTATPEAEATSTATEVPTATATSRSTPTDDAEDADEDDDAAVAQPDSPVATPTAETPPTASPTATTDAADETGNAAEEGESTSEDQAATSDETEAGESEAEAAPPPAELSGRIAFPIDDGGGHYDVWVFELPDGDPFLVQARARQPNFSNDGRLLVNNQDSQFGESLGYLDSNYTWLGIVNDSPHDAFPHWHPDGSRYVYSNSQLLTDPGSGGDDPLPHLFIPCSMQIPSLENNVKCQDIRTNGKVVVGEAPVWTEDDRLAYFSFEGDDGIYVVSSASALWEAGGVGAQKLLILGNGRPTDTDGFQVFFSAGTIDGNWEAYAIDLDGTNLVNLSNAPFFLDGLPTVSPDGNWVAFISDRDGKWGIWAVPRQGGEAQKLLDLSLINTNPSPWGVGERDWMFERISWGP